MELRDVVISERVPSTVWPGSDGLLQQLAVKAKGIACVQGKVSVKGMRWFASKLRNFCTTPPTGNKTRGGSFTAPGPPTSPWTGAVLTHQ